MPHKKHKNQPKKSSAPERSRLHLTNMLTALDPHTVRGISGVLLVVCATLLFLTSIGAAGRMGTMVHDALFALLGIGYHVLPLLLVGWAVSLFYDSTRENMMRPVRLIGGGLFLVSFLALVAVWNSTLGGMVGNALAAPTVAQIEPVATSVLYGGVLLVSLLLMFDVTVWGALFSTMKRMLAGVFTRRQQASADALDTLERDIPLTTVVDTPPEQTGAQPQETYTEETAPQEQPQYEPRENTRTTAPSTTAPITATTPAHQPSAEYVAPPVSLLERDSGKPNVGDTKAQANIIRRTLQHFKIAVEMDEIVVGPTVTRYSLKPAEGVRLNKIVALQSNLELALAASPIRIEAPIPGKSLVGIEVPNTGKSIVGLGGLLASHEFTAEAAPLLTALGKDIAGNAHYANIAKMPHALVAGTTGSGKSVMVHSIVTSLLYRNGPEQLRFIMVDPKRVELTLYNNIPHLLTPVITDAKKCILSLKWATKEMERRYDVLQKNAVQSINAYHQEIYAPAKAHAERMKEKGKDVEEEDLPEGMPHIVIIIDELADIMSTYPRELEALIVRLAQMSRAVGIHLILSTQRPSVNVITGLIKANIPTRIALKVASLIDSRTILDQPGAEKLLGAGDMLYLSGDMAKPQRIQSPFLSAKEVKKVTQFILKHNALDTTVPIDMSGEPAGTATISTGETHDAGNTGGMFDIPYDELDAEDNVDPLYEEIKAFVYKEERISTSLLQRRFRLGYGRGARIVDQLEADGILGTHDATNKGRPVMVHSNEELRARKGGAAPAPQQEKAPDADTGHAEDVAQNAELDDDAWDNETDDDREQDEARAFRG
jgi:DNA segregation ATPase FtsK/SpoIIIE, S-DNA-T family